MPGQGQLTHLGQRLMQHPLRILKLPLVQIAGGLQEQERLGSPTANNRRPTLLFMVGKQKSLNFYRGLQAGCPECRLLAFDSDSLTSLIT